MLAAKSHARQELGIYSCLRCTVAFGAVLCELWHDLFNLGPNPAKRDISYGVWIGDYQAQLEAIHSLSTSTRYPARVVCVVAPSLRSKPDEHLD